MTLADRMVVKQSDRFVGQQIAHRYEVLDVLGEGAMGMIFRAEDTRLGTEVVLKVPAERVLTDPEFIARFKREIRSLVQLSHPHVVNIIDVGEHNDAPFVVMQYLTGGSLSDRREKSGGKMRVETLNEWLSPIADAVDFVHKQDVIHRDVKPANILFDGHGNAFLADFGLSKVLGAEELDERANSLTATGFVVGTPQYVAPEIVMGRDYDGKADQYSLAMTVYEVLAGECPVAGSTPSATMVNQINVVPPLLNEKVSAPVALAKALARGLEKSPKKRFASCGEFAEAMLSALDTPGQSKSSARRRVRKSDAEIAKRSGTSGVRPPKAAKPLKSKGKPGRVPCPKCKKILPLMEEHRGKRGRCVKCRTKLQVGKDLATLTTIEDRSNQSTRLQMEGGPGKLPPRVLKGGKGKEDDGETLLGEEVFGWRLSKPVAAGLSVFLILVLIVAAIFIGKNSKEDEHTETKSTKMSEGLKGAGPRNSEQPKEDSPSD